MAIAQRNIGTGGTGTVGTAASGSATIPATLAGSSVVVVASARTANFAASSPVTDNKGSVYTQIIEIDDTTGTVVHLGVWVTDNCVAGITTITVTGNLVFSCSIQVIEMTGTLTTGSADVSVGFGTTVASTAPASGTSSASIVGTGEAVIGVTGFLVNGITSSAQTFAGTARTISGQVNNGDFQQGVSPAAPISTNVCFAQLSGSTLGTIAYSETLSASAAWCCIAVTFKSAPAANPFIPRLRSTAYLAM